MWPTTGGYTLLHSGRSTSSDDTDGIVREGVGILMNKRATASWMAAGKEWSAVSSRLMISGLGQAGRD